MKLWVSAAVDMDREGDITVVAFGERLISRGWESEGLDVFDIHRMQVIDVWRRPLRCVDLARDFLGVLPLNARVSMMAKL